MGPGHSPHGLRGRCMWVPRSTPDCGRELGEMRADSSNRNAYCKHLLTVVTALQLHLQKLALGRLLLHLEGRVLDPEALAEQELELARGPGRGRRPSRTTTWAASASNPEVTVQTCSSWTLTTPSIPQIACRARRRRRPAAPPPSARRAARGSAAPTRRGSEPAISEARDRVRLAPAGRQDAQRRDDRPPSEPSASAAEWRSTPSRLMSLRSPRARTTVAAGVAGEADHPERRARPRPRRRAGRRGGRSPRPRSARRSPTRASAVDERREHLAALEAEGPPRAAAAGGERRPRRGRARSRRRRRARGRRRRAAPASRR